MLRTTHMNILIRFIVQIKHNDILHQHIFDCIYKQKGAP